MPPSNPADIALETLKLLASRRTPPTPENYQKTYFEISGGAPEGGLFSVEQSLVKLLPTISKSNPSLNRSIQLLERAINSKSSKELEAGLLLLTKASAKSESSVPAWPSLIKELLRQWELKHKGWTTVRKKESLERVLATFGNDSTLLLEKLQGLIKTWGTAPVNTGNSGDADSLNDDNQVNAEDPAKRRVSDLLDAMPAPASNDQTSALRDLLSTTLRAGLAPQLSSYPDMLNEVEQLADLSKAAADRGSVLLLTKGLQKFLIKLELKGEAREKVLDGVVNLLKLIVANISELMADDKWLHGQVAVVQDILSKPLDSRVLYEAERSFKEVIFKQGTLKHSLNEAKTTLKNMITVFIDRLGDMSQSTGGYHQKISGYSQKITATEDITQLNSLLADLMKDTRGLELDIIRTREDLIEARRQVEAAEQRIKDLETELDEISGLVHEDHLTGALNRRGMDDAVEREFARAERLNTPTSLALLDVDHFKKLNDSLGHDAGDEALIHLVTVTRETLRPIDQIARFGGEEFVIILPDTGVEEAIKVMTRVQRELTKRFFLHNNERVLITFSAGIALREPNETAEDAIARADAALYKAKEAGRNRVFAAQASSASTVTDDS